MTFGYRILKRDLLVGRAAHKAPMSGQSSNWEKERAAGFFPTDHVIPTNEIRRKEPLH